jgi:hypothetical protein
MWILVFIQLTLAPYPQVEQLIFSPQPYYSEESCIMEVRKIVQTERAEGREIPKTMFMTCEPFPKRGV